eukprot:TRINITY_DN2900_c0_g1_i2.p2 TRINITY_DN2900_c0_g1~~TRINITY_DN2900_c0_g1_i2.p2  ORF type:complete len:346 (-),score=68.21 TRINITY_DN2900_c0_g1_i2:2149-3186(-)
MARPSRPARRAESVRGLNNTGYSAHYAESPVIPDGGSGGDAGGPPPPRASRRSIHSRSSTLPRGGDVIRSPSRHSRPGTQMSKVTRSRSWGARPPGVVVYNRHGEPIGLDEQLQAPSKPASTIGVGYRPNTALSGKSMKSTATGRTGVSGASTSKSKNTMKAGLAVETMSAPNPFCPDTKGVCCLMVLTNLALILICIGFIIVLQLTEPSEIWNIGFVILIAGFLTLFVTLVYCMCICQETNTRRPGYPPTGELYWTHHWQKNFAIPELGTGGGGNKSDQKWEDPDKFPEDDVSDTSSRDYPRLYLESDYGGRTDRENDLDTDLERAEKAQAKKYREREESPQRY